MVMGEFPFDATDLRLHLAASKTAATTLAQLRAIERKSFPANEVFDFNVGLVGKHNTQIIYASLRSDGDDTPVAYAVLVRWRSVILLQKLCVMARFRGRGIGKIMMLEVMSQARKTRCNAIELWVDMSRTVARGLYASCGFKEVQSVEDYYARGRHGIRMRLDLSG